MAFWNRTKGGNTKLSFKEAMGIAILDEIQTRDLLKLKKGWRIHNPDYINREDIGVGWYSGFFDISNKDKPWLSYRIFFWYNVNKRKLGIQPDVESLELAKKKIINPNLLK